MIQDIEQKRPTTGVKDVLLPHENASPHKARGWSGGAMVLRKLPVPGRPTNLD